MVNRWGLNVRRGMYARVSLARGGHETGRVSKFERISGYGWRLILESVACRLHADTAGKTSKTTVTGNACPSCNGARSSARKPNMPPGV